MNYNIMHREHIFTDSPTGMCHASTVLPLKDEVLAAWFGGSYEGKDDVSIWFSKRSNQCWSSPVKIMQGEEPHWNPVLLDLENGCIALYYKIGREISKWRTMVSYSEDAGENWSKPQELVPGDFGGRGPVRNKIIRLKSGRLLAPASLEHGIWLAFVDLSDDNGKTWTKSNSVTIENLTYQPGERTASDTDIAVSEQSFHGRGVIQPTLWESAPGTVHMLLRSSQGEIYRSDSFDNGETWCPAYGTGVPNNNSGIDVVRMDSGILALAYNPVAVNWGPRSPMTLATSSDNGMTWKYILNLDSGEGEFAYPAITAKGNTLHITYTWKRKSIAYWEIML